MLALLILSTGIVASTRLQVDLHLSAEVARQRGAAVRLAQLDLEGQRGFSRLRSLPGAAAYDDIDSLNATVESGNTRFALHRQVGSDASSQLKSSMVDVRWADRSGTARQVILYTGLGANLPALSGALALPAEATALGPPAGLPLGLPPGARLLGDGRAVWQMAGSPGVAYVVDGHSGEVRSRCSVAGTSEAGRLDATDLVACTAFRATFLQGHVRFSLGAAPDARRADDPPLPFDAVLQLEPGTGAQPQCEAQPAEPRASPAAARTTERFATYLCLVPLAAGAESWSGRFSLAPRGWDLGTAATQRRVCRYSADLDRSGRIDRNEEHPARYSEVSGGLRQQNYLVVRGELSCPHSPPPPHNDDFADTVPHQP